MPADPTRPELNAIFDGSKMFDSPVTWQAAGFDVITGGESSNDIMVASHPNVHGLLFKKFVNKISQRRQLDNYQLRIDGADAVRALVIERQLQRVEVPRKWIHDLPGSDGHVLVVDRVDVLTAEETEKAYQHIDDRTLEDLCVVVHAFRGLDSGPRNLPLTKDGKIAFIDTERWKEDRDRSYLKRVGDYLTSEQRKRAGEVFKRLDKRR